MPKMSEYVKIFKVEYKKNKFMSSSIDYKKLLEKHKTIWTKIKGLKYIKLNTLPTFDDRYIKFKIRTYVDKVFTNSRGLNMPEDDAQFESFTVSSIDSSLV